MKIHPIILLTLILSISACTNSVHKTPSVKQVAEKKRDKTTKTVKHKHARINGIISVDIVNDNKRLHLLTGQYQHQQKTLWYQFSDDGGRNWSAAVKVLNADNLAVKMSRGNDAQIVAQGNNIVVSWTRYKAEVRFHAGEMMAAISQDGGQTWRYAAAPPDWHKGAHGYIDMSADKEAIHAVWLDSRHRRKDQIKASQSLLYSRSVDGGQSWQPNITLDSNSCSCCWNTIKSKEDGSSYVLYRDKQPSDMSLIKIDQQQNTQRLSSVGDFNWQFDGCLHIGGGLDFQNSGKHERLHSVVGTGHQAYAGVYYLYSDDDGKSWSKKLSLGDHSSMHADVAAHDNGRVMAVWDMRAGDELAVFYAQSEDSGTHWSPAQRLSSVGIRASHPRIVKTKAGFLVLWTATEGKRQTLVTRLL